MDLGTYDLSLKTEAGQVNESGKYVVASMASGRWWPTSSTAVYRPSDRPQWSGTLVDLRDQLVATTKGGIST